MSGPSWKAANGDAVHGAAAFYRTLSAAHSSEPQGKKSLVQTLARHRQALVVVALLAALVFLQLTAQKDAYRPPFPRTPCSGDPTGGSSSDALASNSGYLSPEEKQAFLEQIGNCSHGSEQRMKDYFRDIVLIVNNNYDKHAANTTKFWRRFYKRLFHNVVFISANGIPDLDIEGEALSSQPAGTSPTLPSGLHPTAGRMVPATLHCRCNRCSSSWLDHRNSAS